MGSVRSSAINQGFYKVCLEKMMAVNRGALLGKFNAHLILFAAKVSIVLYEFSGAMGWANKALVLGYTLGDQELILKCYKVLGDVNDLLKRPQEALMYYTKYLCYALCLGNRSAEALAYDFIGMQYFHLDQITKSN
jgi:hypothetical protein